MSPDLSWVMHPSPFSQSGKGPGGLTVQLLNIISEDLASPLLMQSWANYLLLGLSLMSEMDNTVEDVCLRGKQKYVCQIQEEEFQ